jgi:hypothetical protein
LVDANWHVRVACELVPNPARDGAAYNPETRSWRRVADAPVPPGSPAALVDGVVFLQAGGGELSAYDVAADRWASHGKAAAPYLSGPMATGGGRLVFADPKSAGLL